MKKIVFTNILGLKSRAYWRCHDVVNIKEIKIDFEFLALTCAWTPTFFISGDLLFFCFLFQARVDEDLLIYEAFPFYQTQIDNHLKIRFKKIQHNLILREKRLSRARKKGIDVPDDTGILQENHVCLMRYFEDISGYSGVSSWLFTHFSFFL